MKELFIDAAIMVAGTGGIISLGWVHKKMPEWHARHMRLIRMSKLELQAELTRCVGAIVTCARKGDRRGMRHAYRAMRPVMRVLEDRRVAW